MHQVHFIHYPTHSSTNHPHSTLYLYHHPSTLNHRLQYNSVAVAPADDLEETDLDQEPPMRPRNAPSNAEADGDGEEDEPPTPDTATYNEREGREEEEPRAGEGTATAAAVSEDKSSPVVKGD